MSLPFTFISTSTSNIILAPYYGNVGIGSTQPQKKLDVTGDVQASNIYVSGAINGSGTGLTNLNASQITTGTLASSILPDIITSQVVGTPTTVPQITIDTKGRISAVSSLDAKGTDFFSYVTTNTALANVTTAQSWLQTGRSNITLQINYPYEIEMNLLLQSSAADTRTLTASFSATGATPTYACLVSTGTNFNSGSSGTPIITTITPTTFNSTVVTNNTSSTYHSIYIRGIVSNSTSSFVFTPRVALSATSTTTVTVLTGSYCRVKIINPSTATSVGFS